MGDLFFQRAFLFQSGKVACQCTEQCIFGNICSRAFRRIRIRFDFHLQAYLPLVEKSERCKTEVAPSFGEFKARFGICWRHAAKTRRSARLRAHAYIPPWVHTRCLTQFPAASVLQGFFLHVYCEQREQTAASTYVSKVFFYGVAPNRGAFFSICRIIKCVSAVRIWLSKNRNGAVPCGFGSHFS